MAMYFWELYKTAEDSMKGWEPWSCCGRVQIQVAFYNNHNVYCAVTSMPSCDLSDRDRDSLSLHVSFKCRHFGTDSALSACFIQSELLRSDVSSHEPLRCMHSAGGVREANVPKQIGTTSAQRSDLFLQRL
jgi:hypothetical protein